MTKQTVLITGGAGFIGAHVNKMLLEAGFHTIIVDNLSQGSQKAVVGGTFIEEDLSNIEGLNKIFTEYSIELVMHFAASISNSESIYKPALYFQNNLVNTINLLNIMLRHSVKNVIFSSSASVFGVPNRVPINENHPKNPTTPYGETKLIVENILADYKKAYGLNYCSMRYFNAAGGDPDKKVRYFARKEHNLIPIIFQCLDQNKPLTVFGTNHPTIDGTCIRDYIHVMDIGQAHILAMKNLLNTGLSKSYNLGNGTGFSIQEVINTVEKVTGKKIQIIEGEKRVGDPPILYADSLLASKELGWCPQYPSLEQMITHAWEVRESPMESPIA